MSDAAVCGPLSIPDIDKSLRVSISVVFVQFCRWWHWKKSSFRAILRIEKLDFFSNRCFTSCFALGVVFDVGHPERCAVALL
jgi:hypothetical protein